MKFITKNDEPQEFIDWKVQEKGRLEQCYMRESKAADCAWEHLPSNLPQLEEDGIIYYTKTKLKENLLNEQGHICAFCMNRLDNDSKCTIDHWVPKSQDARRYTFDYQNLLAACSGTKDDKGRQIKPEDRYCNNKKDDKPIEKNGISIVITPLQDDCEDKFIFAMDGKIYGVDEMANHTIALLGLDSHILIRARKNAIYKYSYSNPMSKLSLNSSDEIQQKLANLKTTKKGKYEPFCVAIEQVLRNILDS